MEKHGTSSIPPPINYTIALVGNPNVGKSTLFNSLTGLNQHTGNWSGKTVSYAKGNYTYQNQNFTLVDLPGAYSLATHSKEEEVTRDFICFKHPDAVIVVCDATCLERNLNLVLQTLTLSTHVIVCINLIDEASKKKIVIDLNKLSKLLHVPVIATCAQKNQGLETLKKHVLSLSHMPYSISPLTIHYPDPLESCLTELTQKLHKLAQYSIPLRFLALKLLEKDPIFLSYFHSLCLQNSDSNTETLNETLLEIQHKLYASGFDEENLEDLIVVTYIEQAEKIAQEVVTTLPSKIRDYDRKIDRFLMGKYTAFPMMFLLLSLILWLTIIGANYPSNLLFNLFAILEQPLQNFMLYLHLPEFIVTPFIQGIYTVLTWVVSVMLPPMAIFFPLFTLLEDLGYLPRVAFNLDHTFKKCHACGKQALTMCMGLGCNAVGVEGCRIIDSPREQLIALLTNSFVPCNGRFPSLILLINMFFISTTFSPLNTLYSALWLVCAILLSLLFTFLTSWLLSRTLLKGFTSSFTLELPPYRKPQIGQILVHSLMDRTLYVLRRAIIVAAPAGLIIWLLANIRIGQTSLLLSLAHFLDPFARLFGLDGIILTAFLLGLPANELVFPIMIMIYMASGTMMPLSQASEIKLLLFNQGWTFTTAICTFLFFLIHWPCTTTLWTIYKESKSIKWTLIAFLLPTLSGFMLCFIVSHLLNFFF
ncbi:MAG: ferrous iron transport protein B [Cellulosilyticum sp.]|nr:ferrous iron transport protein B [Cellulosilyticum sp.]